MRAQRIGHDSSDFSLAKTVSSLLSWLRPHHSAQGQKRVRQSRSVLVLSPNCPWWAKIRGLSRIILPKDRKGSDKAAASSSLQIAHGEPKFEEKKFSSKLLWLPLGARTVCPACKRRRDGISWVMPCGCEACAACGCGGCGCTACGRGGVAAWLSPTGSTSPPLVKPLFLWGSVFSLSGSQAGEAL
jgi:hypothetical protein